MDSGPFQVFICAIQNISNRKLHISYLTKLNAKISSCYTQYTTVSWKIWTGNKILDFELLDLGPRPEIISGQSPEPSPSFVLYHTQLAIKNTMFDIFLFLSPFT